MLVLDTSIHAAARLCVDGLPILALRDGPSGQARG
jgi:hypothetical protein